MTVEFTWAWWFWHFPQGVSYKVWFRWKRKARRTTGLCSTKEKRTNWWVFPSFYYSLLRVPEALGRSYWGRWCWLQGLERLQSGKAEIPGHSFIVEEPAEAETVCLLEYGGLATLICIGLRASSSDIFQSNQVHSHIEVFPPTLIIWVSM